MAVAAILYAYVIRPGQPEDVSIQNGHNHQILSGLKSLMKIHASLSIWYVLADHEKSKKNPLVFGEKTEGFGRFLRFWRKILINGGHANTQYHNYIIMINFFKK